MSPSGGLITTVERLHHVVAGEERLLLLEQVAEVVRRMARRVDRAQGRAARQREALAAAQRDVGHEARVLPLAVRRRRGRARARRSAPSAARVAGEWSMCVWVAKIQRIGPGAAATIARTCASSSGPGSITAHSFSSPPPTR